MVSEELKKIVDQLPLLKQLFEQDVYISVLDREGIVQGYSVPDGVAPQLSVGELFSDPTGAFREVIETGCARKNRLPKEVMGETFEGMLVPVTEEGKVVGCVVCTYSVEIKEKNMEMAENFQNTVRDVQDTIQALVAGIENLLGTLTSVKDVTGNVANDVDTATEVVSKISSNASRSNILALNASIEAARSGEHGRGFAVVATEMGKLANDSGRSASEIKSTLSTITGHMSSIVSSIKDANDVAQEHMDNINDIQRVLSDILDLAEQLRENINI